MATVVSVQIGQALNRLLHPWRTFLEFVRWQIPAVIGDIFYIGLTNSPFARYLGDRWYLWASIVLITSWVLSFVLRKFWIMGHRDVAHIRCEFSRYALFFAVLFPVTIGGIYAAVTWVHIPRILAQAFFMIVPPIIFMWFAKRYVFTCDKDD